MADAHQQREDPTCCHGGQTQMQSWGSEGEGHFGCSGRNLDGDQSCRSFFKVLRYSIHADGVTGPGEAGEPQFSALGSSDPNSLRVAVLL